MRLKVGQDVWECECGAIVLIGRICSCGATYADQLISERKSKKSKYREPAEEREFSKSYLFSKKRK
jgi:hypothetical protein